MFSLSVNMMQKYRKKSYLCPWEAEKEILVVRFYAYIHYCLVYCSVLQYKPKYTWRSRLRAAVSRSASFL